MKTTNTKRRNLLKAGLSLSLAGAMPWKTARAGEDTVLNFEKLPQDIQTHVDRIYGKGIKLRFDPAMLQLDAPRAAESDEVVPIEVLGDPSIKILSVFVPGWPDPLACVYHLHNSCTLPLKFRVKIPGRTTYIYAVAKVNSNYYAIKKKVIYAVCYYNEM